MPGLTLSRLTTKSRQALGGCRQKLTTGIGISSCEQCKHEVRPLCPARGENKQSEDKTTPHQLMDKLKIMQQLYHLSVNYLPSSEMRIRY